MHPIEMISKMIIFKKNFVAPKVQTNELFALGFVITVATLMLIILNNANKFCFTCETDKHFAM